MAAQPLLTTARLMELAALQGVAQDRINSDTNYIASIGAKLGQKPAHRIHDDTEAIGQIISGWLSAPESRIKDDRRKLNAIMKRYQKPTMARINEDATIITAIASRLGRESFPSSGQVGASMEGRSNVGGMGAGQQGQPTRYGGAYTGNQTVGMPSAASAKSRSGFSTVATIPEIIPALDPDTSGPIADPTQLDAGSLYDVWCVQGAVQFYAAGTEPSSVPGMALAWGVTGAVAQAAYPQYYGQCSTSSTQQNAPAPAPYQIPGTTPTSCPDGYYLTTVDGIPQCLPMLQANVVSSPVPAPVPAPLPPPLPLPQEPPANCDICSAIIYVGKLWAHTWRAISDQWAKCLCADNATPEEDKQWSESPDFIPDVAESQSASADTQSAADLIKSTLSDAFAQGPPTGGAETGGFNPGMFGD